MLGSTHIHLTYNSFGKYVKLFSLLFFVQMLEYLNLIFAMTPKSKPSSSHGRGKQPSHSNEPKGKEKAQFDRDLFNL